MNFMFVYCYRMFGNLVSSKLLLRNRDFVYESDAITFFLKYLQYDDNSLKHKLEASFNKSYLDEVERQTSRML